MKELINRVEEAYYSDLNQSKINNNSKVKITAGIGRPILSKVLNFSTTDYFNNPKVCLESQLKWKLFWHNEIQDDTPIELSVGIDYATELEPSLFGLSSVVGEGKEPTYGPHIIHDYEDLDNIEHPDFYKSGIMPRVHEMYQGIKELSDGRLNVFFPGWARGPWSIATILRGFNDLFLDVVDKPEFVHKMLQFIVDSRIKWENQRFDFLNIGPRDRDYRWKYCVYRNNANSDCFEDEVDGNLFSPQMYREFVLPYEKQLSEYYGGINYYHSCGNLTPFLEDMTTLNITRELHVSFSTDLGKAVEIFPENVILQKSLHPINDVMNADEQTMRKKLEDIIKTAEGRTLHIWADALYEGSWDTVKKVKQVVRLFREITG